MGLIAKHQVRAIIGRRCMPELFGNSPDLGTLFAECVAGAGVKQIFLEGRVASVNAVNALSSIDDEVELFAGHYKDRYRYRNVAVLVRQ